MVIREACNYLLQTPVSCLENRWTDLLAERLSWYRLPDQSATCRDEERECRGEVTTTTIMS